MKSIVLAEKPSVARDYAQVLGCPAKGKGYFEGNKYIVTWALGHLVTLHDPAYYDRKYKEWDLADLPIIPEKMRLKIIKQSSAQFSVIKKLVDRKDIDQLIIATDAGREGELVARWIVLLTGWKGQMKRLWISSQTAPAIREGFQNLKDGNRYFRLFLAAVGRAEADWLIGLNVTRALTCKFDAQLTAGRVQTPTLSILIRRENEIKDFKPVDYWKIEADFGGFTGEWRDKSGNSKVFDTNRVQQIAEKLKGRTGIVLNVHRELKKESPPHGYNLTELQRDANNQYGFSAKKTLGLLQGLYERYKITTYPRTDSKYITDDMVPTIPARLKAIRNDSNRNVVDRLLKSGIQPKKHFVDNGKVSDHHAIIPTEEPAPYDKLSSDEKKIFNLVSQRFFEVLSEPSQTEQVVVVLMVNGEKIYIKSSQLIEPGWQGVCKRTADSTALSGSFEQVRNLRKGEKRTVKNTSIVKLKTTPPARYTEASLLSVMESPGKFIEGSDLKESIKKGGLGTPATRADIIEKIINTDYVVRKGKELIPTEKGFQLIELAPKELCSPELTARWEMALSEIENGKERKERFIQDIIDSTRTMVQNIKGDERKFVNKNLTDKKCPVCNKFMLKLEGNRGKTLKCSDRTCGFIQDEGKGPSADSPFFKGSRKESRFNKKMINTYSDNKKKIGGLSIGGLLEAALSEKKKDG